MMSEIWKRHNQCKCKDGLQKRLTQHCGTVATVEYRLEYQRAGLRMVIPQTWNMTYEKMTASRLLEGYDYLFVEIL